MTMIQLRLSKYWKNIDFHDLKKLNFETAKHWVQKVTNYSLAVRRMELGRGRGHPKDSRPFLMWTLGDQRNVCHQHKDSQFFIKFLPLGIFKTLLVKTPTGPWRLAFAFVYFEHVTTLRRAQILCSLFAIRFPHFIYAARPNEYGFHS